MTIEKKAVAKKLLEGLLAHYRQPEDAIGEKGLLKPLTTRLVARALQVKNGERLGHAKNESLANEAGSTRNIKSHKIFEGRGELPIEIPRARYVTLKLQLPAPPQAQDWPDRFL